MTNLEKILRDLSISQTTASSLAPRVNMQLDAVVVCLEMLIAQGKVEGITIKNAITHKKTLTVYRLKSS